MRTQLSVLALMTMGCGTMGLSSYDTAVGAEDITLGVDPRGNIEFGRVSPSKSKSELQDVVLYAQGEGMLNIVDVYLSDSSSTSFSMRQNLPLPMRMEDGEEFPVQVRFLPSTVGMFTGELVILLDDGSPEGDEVYLPLSGKGCEDPGETGACD